MVVQSGNDGIRCVLQRTPILPHSFSDSEMRVFTAICNAFVPSLPYGESSDRKRIEQVDEQAGDAHSESKNYDDHNGIHEFYRLTASDADLPSEIAGQLSFYIRPCDLGSILSTLRLLSTRLGTLLFGGSSSFTWKFPFLHDYSSLPLENREKILRRWSTGSSVGLQKLFKVLKSYILLAFYTKVDEKRIWNAIGYAGPDPELTRPNSNHISSQGCLQGSIVRMHEIDNPLKLLDRMDCSVVNPVSVSALSDKDTNGSFDIRIICDAVVIGSGSGGGVAAAVLAQAGYKVLVLEKGDYFGPGDLSLLEGPSYKAMYEGGAYLSTEDGSVLLMAGSTVGGGTAINWSASFRTPEHVLNEWAENHELEFFVTKEYSRAMDVVCKRLEVQDSVIQESFQNAILRKGCGVLNYHVGNVPRNCASDHSCGWCGMGCKSGQKMSSSETWLADAVKAGAVILSGCEAKEILHTPNDKTRIKPKRTCGVIASTVDGTRRLLIQAKAVVVACGALWTPILLTKSGLRNPNIGKNLHIHPVMSAWGYFPEDRGEPGRCYEGAIMTAFSKVASNWESSGYGSLLMVPAIHPGAYSILMPWLSGAESKKRMIQYSRTSHIIAITRDKDGGSVCLDKDGRLKVSYKISEHDRESCLTGVEHALKILIASGATEVGTYNNDGETYKVNTTTKSSNNTTSAARSDDATLQQFVNKIRSKALRKLNTPLASAHQMGSCRMGSSAESSVVDAQGETWEVEGLFVGDGSVFPTASGVNPMITVQAIAYCTALSALSFLGKTHTHPLTE